jgi:tetratricopeptide (TPR) repeat protein
LAIRGGSNYALAYYWRGASYLKLGQDQRAIEDYDHSIWLEATSFFYEQRGLAYSWKGNAYYALDQKREGDAAWATACGLNSRYCK